MLGKRKSRASAAAEPGIVITAGAETEPDC